MAPELNPGSSASPHLTAVTDGVAQGFTWDDNARIEVRALGGEIVIEANADGLRTLARHLLTLAQDGTPDGAHLHLEAGMGLAEGSRSLVLERCDDD
ncbi:Imm32 family immunity protein [Actinacidiphila glaucinigra]|uniref:Imm32 family immunity protein n=1 Tax=Actinacidiphila glaucinigra TaxID=235986 RepID=UPI003D929649